MDKKLNFKNLKNTNKHEVKKVTTYTVFLLIFIMQIGIAVVLYKNDKVVQENGTIYRMKLDSVNVDFIENRATVEFYKSENRAKDFNQMDIFSYEINEITGLYYNVEKDKYNKAYLVDTDLNRRNENNFLQETTGVKNHFTKPEYYIEGDKLKTMETGNFGRLGYLNLEADVIVYNGAYIIQEIYINRVPYEEFIKDNYFELLDVDEI